MRNKTSRATTRALVYIICSSPILTNGHSVHSKKWGVEAHSEALSQSLLAFKNEYGEAAWKQVHSYHAQLTRAGAVIEVFFSSNKGNPESASYICRFIEYNGHPRMHCHEH